MDTISYLMGKNASGGSDSYKTPIWFSNTLYGQDGSGTSLTVNIDSKITNNYKRPTEKGIVLMFVRNDYSVSNNVTVIGESDYVIATDNTPQKIIIGWCDDFTQDITLTQTSSARLGIWGIMLDHCIKPTANEIVYNETTRNSSVEVTTPQSICIYMSTNVYASSSTTTIVNDSEPFFTYFLGDRNRFFVTYYSDTISIPVVTNGSALIGIKILPSNN